MTASPGLSLIPPLLVLLAAIVTANLRNSLAMGIACAALIMRQGNLEGAITSIASHIYEHITDPGRLCLYGFSIAISILITLLNSTGSAIAFARAITKKLQSKRMAELSTVGLLCALFIDDYLNVLTVGYVMRPITDRFAIPRAKLAFLVHSLSGPLVILAPISSWVAVITAQLDQAGISPLVDKSTTIIGESFMIYLQTIPFIFYSLILIGSLLFIICRGISFGPMHYHEQLAAKTGNLFGGKNAPQRSSSNDDGAISVLTSTHGRSIDLILPLVVLVGSVVIGILYFGDYYLFGGARTLVQAAQHNTQTELVLFLASLLALTTSIALTFYHQSLHARQLPAFVKEGIQLITPSIMIVVYATIFGRFLSELNTGGYLANAFLQHTPLALLPCILFITSMAMAIITGSSWGTMAILVPISIQMLLSLVPFTIPVNLEQIPLLLPILGAIFSGAVCGNHVSPLAETTIMAATSSGSNPFDHITTQFPYALTVIISSCCAFLSAGFLIHYGITIALGVSLAIGLLVCFAALTFFNYLQRTKMQPN